MRAKLTTLAAREWPEVQLTVANKHRGSKAVLEKGGAQKRKNSLHHQKGYLEACTFLTPR